MTTQLERIAAKARSEPKFRFTSLAHHLTRERVWENLCRIPLTSAPGVDGQTVAEAKESFEVWIEPMLGSVHRKGYRAPVIRRVYIPKPGKQEKRPLGVPCVSDRALQRSTAQVLAAIYEQDFLPCSFGGRPDLSAHHALATLNEVIAGGKVSWVLEADVKNFFGSLDHIWLLRFVELRVGDPRLISLIRRWLKAGILEDGEVHPSEEGTPQGGSISVLLSNLYLHYVLDLWFEHVVRSRLRGEAYLVRYIDDFVLCFQYRSASRMPSPSAWGSLVSPWSRARPSWWSSAALPNGMLRDEGANAQRRSTFWALPSTARAIRRAGSWSVYVRRSPDFAVAWPPSAI
jgi:group II intron reverse transcriptase/maturase